MDSQVDTLNNNNSILTNNYSYSSNLNNIVQDSGSYYQAMLGNLFHDTNSNHLNFDNSIEQSKNSNMNQIFETSSLYSSNNSEDNNESSEDSDIIFTEKRAATAPAKPINEAEEFKWNSQYSNLERCVFLSNNLKVRNDNKFDVDSEEGLEICKKFLEALERLIKSLKISTSSREYRKGFSRAYKYLYSEGLLCYLTEILDSAQEGTPCLWVNGDNYSFSAEVLEKGEELYKKFCQIILLLKQSFSKAIEDYFYENIHQIKSEMKLGLEDFDKTWVAYENKYIYELIDIENKSRRFVTDAIEKDKKLKEFEERAKNRGQILLDSAEFNKLRRSLVNNIVQINKVANTNGKGRDDLTLDILLAAEGVLRRISHYQSRSIRFLADSVKQSFLQMRLLFRKYDENIEIVDPQLKNNPDLVDSLFNFESTWEKGKEYLINTAKSSQLIQFSQLIDILCEKYSEIKDQIESRDPDIFVWIPSILVLKSLHHDDSGICKEYNPNMYDLNQDCGKVYNDLVKLSKLFNNLADDKYFLYNSLEQLILFENLDAGFINTIGKVRAEEFLNKIKILSMNLQRIKAADWNNFIDLAMNAFD